MKATASGGLEDLTFQISEGSDQNWSCPKPSEILNLRTSNTPEIVAFTIPWYLGSLKNPESPNVHDVIEYTIKIYDYVQHKCSC